MKIFVVGNTIKILWLKMFTLKDNLKCKGIYYAVLIAVIAFYATEFGIGHYTHTLVILMDSYSTLCNILGLLAVIIANKFGQSASETTLDKLVVWTTNTPVVQGDDSSKFRNTFGWKRYLTLSLLIRYVFLSSTVFSLSLEALENLVAHDGYVHKGNFCFPLCVAVAGIILNIIFHLALHEHINYYDITLKNGTPMAIAVSTTEDATENISKSKTLKLKIRLILSDFIGSIIVLVYSGIAYVTNIDGMVVYADSILSLMMGACQLILNFPLMKESCAILLQKIPETIDIDNLRKQLLEKFPDVLNIHDLHVWQLTAEKVVSTVHITFRNPTVYPKLTRSLVIFFQKFGIDEATIQPEFLKDEPSRSIQFANVTSSCLMECQNDGCKESFCCPITLPQVISRKNKANLFKDSVVDSNSVSVKSMKIYSTQQTFLNKEFSKE